MGARTFIVFLLVLAVLGLLGYGLLSKGEKALAVGDEAPDKELSTLDGPGPGSLADYRGEWVLVNFWASWCEPCRSEAPALEELHRSHPTGSRWSGIDLDDTPATRAPSSSSTGSPTPSSATGTGASDEDAYGMTGFPESFLVDPEGRIALIRRGPVDDAYLAEYVEPKVPDSKAPK